MAHPFTKLEKLEISDSSRKSFLSCPRKFEFRKLYNSSRRDDSLAAGAGTAIHGGMQMFMQHDCQDANKAYMQFLLDFPIEFDEGPMKPRSLEACYATMQVAMTHPRLKEYELAKILVNGEERYCVEVPFRFRIADFSLGGAVEYVPVFYNGRLDLILYDRLNDRYVVVDIKTTTKDMGDATPMYQFEEQLIPYAIVLERLLGKPINNLTVVYMQMYISVTEPRCRWYEFEKNSADVQDWLRGLLVDLQQMAMFYQLGWFPRRGSSCTAYNRTCTHFDVCQTRDPKNIELMLGMANGVQADANAHAVEPWVEIELHYNLGGA